MEVILIVLSYKLSYSRQQNYVLQPHTPQETRNSFSLLRLGQESSRLVPDTSSRQNVLFNWVSSNYSVTTQKFDTNTVNIKKQKLFIFPDTKIEQQWTVWYKWLKYQQHIMEGILRRAKYKYVRSRTNFFVCLRNHKFLGSFRSMNSLFFSAVIKVTAFTGSIPSGYGPLKTPGIAGSNCKTIFPSSVSNLGWTYQQEMYTVHHICQHSFKCKLT